MFESLIETWAYWFWDERPVLWKNRGAITFWNTSWITAYKKTSENIGEVEWSQPTFNPSPPRRTHARPESPIFEYLSSCDSKMQHLWYRLAFDEVECHMVIIIVGDSVVGENLTKLCASISIILGNMFRPWSAKFSTTRSRESSVYSDRGWEVAGPWRK